MPVVTYVDPDSVHNPSSGGIAPATWFTTIEADFRSLLGRVSARIYNDTNEDFAIPGPTTLLLPDIDFNNGMTLSTANTIIVPASYAGKYLISGTCRTSTVPSAPNYTVIFVAVNGTSVMQSVANRSGASGSIATLAVSFVYALAVADALTLQVATSGLTDADTEVGGGSQPSLSAIWLSP